MNQVRNYPSDVFWEILSDKIDSNILYLCSILKFIAFFNMNYLV